MKRIFCTLFTAIVVLASALCITAGEKYRVTANYVVIYDAEQPSESIGRMNRGEQFEVIEKNRQTIGFQLQRQKRHNSTLSMRTCTRVCSCRANSGIYTSSIHSARC